MAGFPDPKGEGGELGMMIIGCVPVHPAASINKGG